MGSTNMDMDVDDMHLTTLPTEILQNILIFLDPASLLRAARVCRLFNELTKDNQTLFRDVYLINMDPPPSGVDMDWRRDIYDFVKLEKLFNLRGNSVARVDEVPFVSDTVVRFLANATCVYPTDKDSTSEPESRNVDQLRRLFENELAAEVYMQQSTLFRAMDRAGLTTHYKHQSSEEKHQQSAKLHVLYGKPLLKSARLRSDKTYPFACSKVYDLRQYTQRTRWGPFRDDASDRVDWEKLEAICIVLRKNLAQSITTSDIFSNIWDTPFAGSFPRSYVPTIPTDPSDLDAQDPYGVAGSWYRVVCFLDYSDFFHFNFSLDPLVQENMPRPPLNVGEATRYIIMRLKVTSIEPPGSDDGQALPVVHFVGESRSLDDSWDENANSGLRGSVRLTREGEVRWTSVSVFNGEERWKSEGVQVGGVGSARGVIGNWFDIDYDIHDPAGPTAFWKAGDAEDPRRALMPRGLVDLAGYNIEAHNLHAFMVDGSDDDDEDDEFDDDGIEEELPGLLADAGMDLSEVVQLNGQS